GTVGIVSLSLLLEKIVGPLGDELAGMEKDFEVIGDNTYQVDGAMRIVEANEEMSLNLPEGDYETIAGFVLSRLGHIPKVDEQLKYKDLRIVVTVMRGRKIVKVMVTREPRPEEVLSNK
ncbi:MAG: transporter associated domain-containing protein, partial [Dehalococcoidales bacterium]|nr:transporter associated domain-containing protein [Dehalococcoidales bacterium]